MAESGPEGEQPQRRFGVKEQQNGELTESVSSVDEKKERDREERESLVLWKKPLLTLHYFTLELLITLKEWIWRLWQQRQTVFGLLILLILLSIAYLFEGTHQKYVRYMEKKTLWCAYWVGLGILSSVGLGTGLHTFLLYLSLCGYTHTQDGDPTHFGGQALAFASCHRNASNVASIEDPIGSKKGTLYFSQHCCVFSWLQTSSTFGRSQSRHGYGVE